MVTRGLNSPYAGRIWLGSPQLVATVPRAQPNPPDMGSPPTNKKGFEVYIPGEWTIRNPLGKDFTSISPRPPHTDIPTFNSLQAFKITRLMHTTHQDSADSIVRDNAFIPSPLLATPGLTFEQRTQMIKGDSINPVTPLRGEIIPGKYVWFSIDVDLSFEQKDACKRILSLPTNSRGSPKDDFWYKQPVKFTDYIEHHSRYGDLAFRIDLVSLLENYRHSRKLPASSHLPNIYFKLGGTKRYKNTATYVIIVCVIDPFLQEDPLPEFVNLTRLEVQSQQVFDPKGLLNEKGCVRCDNYGSIVRGIWPEFRPQGITVAQYDTKSTNWSYHDWDQLDFAFHFPSDSLEKLHCGVFPQKVYHSYCVPLKKNKIDDCGGLQGDFEGVPPHLIDRFS